MYLYRLLKEGIMQIFVCVIMQGVQEKVILLTGSQSDCVIKQMQIKFAFHADMTRKSRVANESKSKFYLYESFCV